MDNPANPNIHTIVKAQIVFLLSTLTEDNFERNQVEIRSVRGLLFFCGLPRVRMLMSTWVMGSCVCVCVSPSRLRPRPSTRAAV